MEIVLDALRRRGAKVRQVKPGHWMAQCPAHDDRTPSLSVDKGENGTPLIQCFAGCETEAVLNTIGLKWADILGVGHAHPVHRRQQREATSTVFADIAGAIGAIKTQSPHLKAAGSWVYTDSEGVPAFAQLRFDETERDKKTGKPKKTFRLIRRVEAGWEWGRPVGPLPLYRMPELLARPTETVFVLEGEKSADAGAEIGLLTTSSACGAGQAGLSDWSPLAGRHVVILPDNDRPGTTHANDVAGRLVALGCEVRVVELPGLPTKGDIVDWLSPDGPAGSVDAEGARSRIQDLVNKATPWKEAMLMTNGARDVSRDGDADMEESVPVVLRLSDVEPKPVVWLWPSRMALGKLTLIAGDPGVGKSFITLDMIARVTTGAGWPDHPEDRTAPGGVVLLSAEDDPADTIRPRLDAAGADVSRVVVLTAVMKRDADGRVLQKGFSLADDLSALEKAIAGVPDCRMVVMDPVSCYLGTDADSHKNSDVRALLAPLSELASRRGIAVVAVTHLRKGEGPAMYRSMGSLAFVAAARAVFLVCKDTESDQSGRTRLFLPVKNNIGNDSDGLAYSLESMHSPNGQPIVAWSPDPVKKSADEVLSSRQGGKDGALDGAKEWLRGALEEGPRPANELYPAARKDGIAKSTLNRAKAALGIKSDKRGFAGGWIWKMPKQKAADTEAGNAAEPS